MPRTNFSKRFTISSLRSSSFGNFFCYFFGPITIDSCWAGALVWWLWEETHVPKVVSSNPGTVNWMDIFSYLFVVKCVLEKMKINEKEVGVGLFFLKKPPKS